MTARRQTAVAIRRDAMQDVTIYTRKFCGYCAAAKELLASKGVIYRELDGTYDADIRAEMIERSRGGRTFPQIFVGDTHVGGCDDLHDLDAAGKLDGLLGAEKAS
jgi:glutaredoxin 3